LALPGEHLEAARRNLARASTCAPDDAWVIVFLFYGVLHLVDGYLKTKGARFAADNHSVRWSAIKTSPELRQATAAYRALQSLSEQVRYDPVFTPTLTEFAAATKHAEKVWGIVEPKLLRGIVAP